MHRITIGLSCMLVSSIAAAGPLSAADCTVYYENGEGSLGSSFNVAVSEAQPRTLPDGYKDGAQSPQHTSSLVTYRFDSKKAGSGPIVVALHTRRGKDIYLSFTPARDGEARWLNEDLVYIQVWWGRIVSSEIVFDASDQTFVYRKLANYGFGINPDCAQVEK